MRKCAGGLSIGLEVAKRLKATWVFGDYQHDLETRFEDVQDQDEFNDVLEDLYDAADELWIWIK